MPKRTKQSSREEQALKPEMRDLILRFDAKDRRDHHKNGGSKQRRRRGDKPVH